MASRPTAHRDAVPRFIRRGRSSTALLTGAVALASVPLAVQGLTLGAAQATTTPVNASFEQWPGLRPRCWHLEAHGRGRSTLTVSGRAQSGTRSAGLDVRSLTRNGTRSVIVDQRSPGCAPSVRPGERYRLGAYYRSSVRVRLVVRVRTSSGWRPWLIGSASSPATRWSLASLLTPAVPNGVTAVSVGAQVRSPGRLYLDSVSLRPRPKPQRSTSPTLAPAATSSPTAPAPTLTSTPTPMPTTSGPAPALPLGTDVVGVSTPAQLSSALASATPGQTISLADGAYRGNFTLARSGTEASPIRLTGSRNAVIDGGGTGSGYALHLDRANYVRVDGLSVQNAQKAVVLDQSSHDVLARLDLHTTGDEVVLLRNFSSDNVVSDNLIHDSGHAVAGYGEGVYVGLSSDNWSTTGQSRTGGAPDTSDRNQILHNRIWATTAENIDIKEGTTGGLLQGNTLDSGSMAGANYADSWIDIAGNAYQVVGNLCTNPGGALRDGIQTHRILTGWANNNVFSGNSLAVNAAGYGINVETPANGNVVRRDNVATGAGAGLSDIAVTP